MGDETANVDALRAEISALTHALADERRLVTKLRHDLEDLDRHTSMLASLYAAAYRLHGAYSRSDVYAAIHEIIANIIGSEENGIFDLREGRLSLVSSVGKISRRFDDIEVGAGVIGEAVATGRTWVRRGAEPTNDEENVVACIPLRFDRNVRGAIAIFRLLPQKPAFDEGDFELFDFLSTRAACALECACALNARAPTLLPTP